ncbi:hypothetical protein OESDEN_08117 [Oesophagostomum dentatum]|uniref:GH18 domain-containing protein n=1 Tax=Oesophagostomum dentatum TaxID=61180 RepID=A0A0B1T352_OESDE|nr:hypothetical protein OESDEN_08117 [Oesophagostomum dentatum]
MLWHVMLISYVRDQKPGKLSGILTAEKATEGPQTASVYNWPKSSVLYSSKSGNLFSSGETIRLDELQALRQKYGNELLITLAVSGPPTITKVAYDVPSFNRYVDLVQVMNYDFHVFSYLFPFVGFNAPLRRLNGVDKLWETFEDERSVRAKARYAKDLNIAGVMVFQIGTDDVYGSCGNGTYPLLRAIKQEID